MTPLDVMWVGLGGGLGSLLRWFTGRVVGEHYHGDFPVGTFLINVSGAFAIGFLSVLFKVDWRDRYGTALNAGVLTGMLGGYTTFSSMQLDAVKLAGRRGGLSAVSYLLLSVLVGQLARPMVCRFPRSSSRARPKRCTQPLIEIFSIALDRGSANWRNLCIIELVDSENGSGMSDRMRVMVRSILTGVIMLVFILPFDYFSLLRSRVVQLPIIACTAAAASFIAGRLVEWMSRRPS